MGLSINQDPFWFLLNYVSSKAWVLTLLLVKADSNFDVWFISAISKLGENTGASETQVRDELHAITLPYDTLIKIGEMYTLG